MSKIGEWIISMDEHQDPYDLWHADYPASYRKVQSSYTVKNDYFSVFSPTNVPIDTIQILQDMEFVEEYDIPF